MKNETILIAVDGGGTGCRAAAGTTTRGILAQAQGGPSNVENDFDAAIANIKGTVAAALAQAGLADTAMAQITAHVGAAGANNDAITARVAAALPYGQTTITGDKPTTVAGALGQEDGFVLAVGTGTFIATQQAGVVRTVAGWGFQISDQASGAWLGHGLLRASLLAHEGMAEGSPLTHATLARFDGMHGMLAFGLTAKPTDYATLAPDVLRAAGAGDAVALTLVREGVAYLQSGLMALGFQPGDRLCLTGGVGPHYASHLPAETTRNLVAPQGNALHGAFALAAARAAAPHG